jgi:hypothetical protein
VSTHSIIQDEHTTPFEKHEQLMTYIDTEHPHYLGKLDIPKGHQTLIVVNVVANPGESQKERAIRFVGSFNNPSTIKVDVVSVADGKIRKGLHWFGTQPGGVDVEELGRVNGYVQAVELTYTKGGPHKMSAIIKKMKEAPPEIPTVKFDTLDHNMMPPPEVKPPLDHAEVKKLAELQELYGGDHWDKVFKQPQAPNFIYDETYKPPVWAGSPTNVFWSPKTPPTGEKTGVGGAAKTVLDQFSSLTKEGLKLTQAIEDMQLHMPTSLSHTDDDIAAAVNDLAAAEYILEPPDKTGDTK